MYWLALSASFDYHLVWVYGRYKSVGAEIDIRHQTSDQYHTY